MNVLNECVASIDSQISLFSRNTVAFIVEQTSGTAG